MARPRVAAAAALQIQGIERKPLIVHGFAAKLAHPNRILLAAYCLALGAVMLFPVKGESRELLAIGLDKWAHLALFGGLAALLQWNLGVRLRYVVLSIVAASAFAAATEVVQGMMAHRSASWADLLAGMLGATIGAIVMHRVLFFDRPERIVGLGVASLGAMIGAIFMLADVIGLGDTSGRFGLLQGGGAALGLLIAVGGVRVFLVGQSDGLQPGTSAKRHSPARPT